MNEYDEEFVEKCKQFAIKHHGNQLYGVWPYIVHLINVEKIVYNYGYFHRGLAYLHDVIEDTSVTYEQLCGEFDDKVGICVSLIMTDSKGKNRKERKKNTNSKLKEIKSENGHIFGLKALVVKVADRLANTRECIRNNPGLLAMYKGEYDEFKEAVYRPGLCDELWKELDSLMGMHLH